MEPARTPVELVRRLTEIGAALSAEKDHGRLMESILQAAREMTGADGGTLYSRTERDTLEFEIMLTESLGIHLGGTSGKKVTLPPIALFDEEGSPNLSAIAAYAAVSGKTVSVSDAYDTSEFDFSGTRAFDKKTGYRSQSFLTVPMRNHDDAVIGVLQLINARGPQTASPRPFSSDEGELVASLASQAAIALTNRRLLEEQKNLFDSFVQLIAGAIDDKSPHTGGHCRRVPELTMMLADAASSTQTGPLADFQMSEEDRYELHIAGWLHDCGKVTTPEHVVDKATKLQTIVDRVELVKLRVKTLKQQARIDFLEQASELDQAEHEAALASYNTLTETLDDELQFIERFNIGGEFMAAEDMERVHRVGARILPDGADQLTLLNENEVYNMCVSRGTLNDDERKIINHHIVATINMLESLPYPRHLQRVPEFAGGHHERMDGQGYPRGLTRQQMSVQARVMGIADVFEALTAGDRPYKKAMKLSQALGILGRMKEDEHVDPDLFDVFVREKIYLRYAEEFLPPDQIDDIDAFAIPGYVP
ncbi:MAG: GAF domain-containing protein [Chromatiales bacterium]|jgi:HD-GYP domain-containing protein (c-di-GMP phosphodiesterase class II)|nr:GAF domain-containing protein [Chromatiales bacterium]